MLTPAGRVPWGWRSPAKTRAALSPGTGTPNAPSRYSIRRSASTSASAPPATSRAPRQQFGWHALTPTEHSVADLVAEGLSNPQIGARLYISHRTVQTHLAHIFAKLDISARAQLAAEVTRRRRDEMRP